MAAGRPVIIAVDTPLNPVAEAAAGLTIPPEDPHELADAIRTLARMAVSERSAYGPVSYTHLDVYKRQSGCHCAETANAAGVMRSGYRGLAWDLVRWSAGPEPRLPNRA